MVVVKAAAFRPRALARAEGVKAACWLAKALCAPADAAVPSVTVITSASTEVTVVETVPSALDATPRFPARAVVSTVEAVRLPVLPSPSSLVTSKLPEPDCKRLPALLLRYRTVHAVVALHGGVKVAARAVSTWLIGTPVGTINTI